MRSIVTVTDAALGPLLLTTLTRVKAELDITNSTNDALIEQKIEDASSRIQAYLGFALVRETVSETFRAEGYECVDKLILNRAPVVTVTSVTVDDVALTSSEYEKDEKAGLLHRLDTSGYPMPWEFCKSVVVAYSGGFIMPGESNETLEPAIEAGAVALVRALYFARRRDPLVKSVDIPGVISEQYWIGSMGDVGSLPPDVEAMIAPFRRVRV